MVYALNNWHDVSWDTKGSDTSEALPWATVVKDEDANADMVRFIGKSASCFAIPKGNGLASTGLKRYTLTLISFVF